MAEYIDREALVEHLNVLSYGRFTEMPLYMAVMGTINEIKKFPAADVQPVVHGRWIDEGVEVGSHTNGIAIINVTFCSECDEQVDYRTSYCPNCGARMDGDA